MRIYFLILHFVILVLISASTIQLSLSFCAECLMNAHFIKLKGPFFAAVPQARKASLARFLEKRKERYFVILLLLKKKINACAECYLSLFLIGNDNKCVAVVSFIYSFSLGFLLSLGTFLYFKIMHIEVCYFSLC